MPATRPAGQVYRLARLHRDAQLLAEGTMGCAFRQRPPRWDTVFTTMLFGCKRDVNDMRDVGPRSCVGRRGRTCTAAWRL
jgi:hypothetical protein